MTNDDYTARAARLRALYDAELKALSDELSSLRGDKTDAIPDAYVRANIAMRARIYAVQLKYNALRANLYREDK